MSRTDAMLTEEEKQALDLVYHKTGSCGDIVEDMLLTEFGRRASLRSGNEHGLVFGEMENVTYSMALLQMLCETYSEEEAAELAAKVSQAISGKPMQVAQHLGIETAPAKQVWCNAIGVHPAIKAEMFGLVSRN